MFCSHSFEGRKEGKREGKEKGRKEKRKEGGKERKKEEGRRERRKKDEGKPSSPRFGGVGCHWGGAFGPGPGTHIVGSLGVC